jgi:pilus assembly protein CpaE
VDEGADATVLLAAMRAGSSQVVPMPLDGQDFQEALDCVGVHFGRSPRASRLVAVSGVTGGCGATTLAINLAHEMAQVHGRQTILTELSLQIGMLVTYLDIQPKYTLDDLLTYQPELDVHLVDRALTPLRDKLSILPGPKRPATQTKGSLSRIAQVLDFLRHLADVVVLDVPCTLDDSYFDLLAAVDHVVLVGEQRIPAVRNVQLVLESLGRSEAGGKRYFAVNRYDHSLEGFTARDLEKLLGTSRVVTMANDPARVTQALNRGQALREAAPNSPVLADVRALARALFDLNEASSPAAGGRNVFGRLFQAIGLGK